MLISFAFIKKGQENFDIGRKVEALRKRWIFRCFLFENQMLQYMCLVYNRKICAHGLEPEKNPVFSPVSVFETGTKTDIELMHLFELKPRLKPD
jgi:hypothetical protein